MDRTQATEPESRVSVVKEVVMNALKAMWKKAALAGVTLGGFLAFGGASNAQAHEVVVVRRAAPVVVVHRGFYAPRPYYYGYGRPVYFEHGWRDRFGCWHRY
jgi:hypothetical protein